MLFRSVMSAAPAVARLPKIIPPTTACRDFPITLAIIPATVPGLRVGWIGPQSQVVRKEQGERFTGGHLIDQNGRFHRLRSTGIRGSLAGEPFVTLSLTKPQVALRADRLPEPTFCFATEDMHYKFKIS